MLFARMDLYGQSYLSSCQRYFTLITRNEAIKRTKPYWIASGLPSESAD